MLHIVQRVILCFSLLVVHSCSHTSLKFSSDYESRKSTHEARGKNWVIATQGVHTTKAGEEIIAAGGNIVDVATAVSFAIGVERPQSTGIGGGGFLLYHKKGWKKPKSWDFREMAPLSSHSKMYLDEMGNEIEGKSLTGIHAVGVPGLVKGILEIHEKYGKLPLKTILAPSIRMARDGFAVYPELSEALEDKKKELARFPSSKKIFFRKGDVYKEGEILKQEDLAKTLERISDKGMGEFYSGITAGRIVKTSMKYGGLITHQDLKNYEVKRREPVEGTYRGHRIFSMAPPSSGGAHVIQILNTVEKDRLVSKGPYDPSSIHLWSASMQAAFADRAAYLGDSDFVKVPLRGLVSKNYAAKIRQRIPEKMALRIDESRAGNPFAHETDHTTHFTIMDGEGNAIVSTQTINGWFGSSLVAEETGIVLNNEMDDFATKVGASNLFGALGGRNNLVEPKKRPLSSMSPTLVFKDGSPYLALGTPSGTRILTCVAQTMLNVLEYQMNLYDAVSSLRYHHQYSPDHIRVEEPGFPQNIQKALEKMGYSIKKQNLGCRIQAAMKMENGELVGVSDPRGEGGVYAL